MKIFGYEFRKFEESTTTIEMVETWCVKWSSFKCSCLGEDRIPGHSWQVQAFPTKDGASFFANELHDARKLLGDRGFKVLVYRQETATNAK